MVLQEAEWKGQGGTTRIYTDATDILRNLDPGQSIRIHHEGLRCGDNCILMGALNGLGAEGYKFRMYHEAVGVAVVLAVDEETFDFKTEKATWKPPKNIGYVVGMSDALMKMTVGQVVRIDHRYTTCNATRCNLSTLLAYVSKKSGNKYERYHEEYGIAIVRRIS